MAFLLDTDTLVFFLRGRPEVQARILNTSADDLATSSVCIGELHYGAYKSRAREERLAEVLELQRSLHVLPFEEGEAARFGSLKQSLEARGERLADADLMIAATALEHDLTLVTGNLAHFERISDLVVESWIDRDGSAQGSDS